MTTHLAASSAFLSNLQAWTAKVAAGYLHDDVEPSDAILKLAVDNELTGDQVRRLCEACNHMIFKELFSKSAEDVFDFPVADHAKVMALMGETDGAASDAEKTAQLDFARAPGEVLPGSGDILDRVFRSMFPKNAVDMDARYGSAVKQRRKTVLALRNKVSEARAIVESRKIAEEMALGRQGDKIYHGVRQMILSGQPLEDVYQFVHNLYPAEDLTSASGVFSEILRRLKEDNLVDPAAEVEAFEPAAKIVNREHPVAREISSFRERTAGIRKLGRVVKRFDRDLEKINVALSQGFGA